MNASDRRFVAAADAGLPSNTHAAGDEHSSTLTTSAVINLVASDATLTNRKA